MVGHIERLFRHALVYPVLRLVFRNRPVPLPIDLSRVRRLLLLRTDRLGDMVVTSSLIRRIREVHPTITLGVVVSRRNIEAARLVEGIDALHVIGGRWSETLRSVRDARSRKYEVVLNLVFNRTTLGGVLCNVIAPQGVKVGQGAEKYRFYFNAMVALDRGTMHMMDVLRSFGRQAFGDTFGRVEAGSSLRDEPHAASRIEAFIGRRGAAPVLLNLSAGHPDRSLSAGQASEIVRGLLARGIDAIVISSAPGDDGIRKDLVRASADSRVAGYPETGDASFAELVALVRRSRMVITPDTSLVHIAGATRTPLIALYVDPFAHAEWHPRGTEAEVIMGDPTRPMSDILPIRVLEAFDRIAPRVGR